MQIFLQSAPQPPSQEPPQKFLGIEGWLCHIQVAPFLEAEMCWLTERTLLYPQQPVKNSHSRSRAAAPRGPLSALRKWRLMIIQLYFLFELRKMTSLSDFKHSLFLVLWVILPESQTAPFRNPDPKDSPCLGQDESQLVILQNAWEAVCPVIRVALEGRGFCKMEGQPQSLWLEAPSHIWPLSAPGESVTS